MNKKFKAISIAIILLLVGFQYLIVLDGQKSLPSEDWSRSFPSNVDAGNYANLKSIPTESGYATSLLDFDKMDLLTCTDELQCAQVWSNSELNPYKNTWSDVESTYFIKEDTLISSTTSGEIAISDNVDDFAISEETLMYWLKDQQVVIHVGDKVPASFTSEYPIFSGKIIDEHFFIITKNTRDNEFMVLGGKNEFKELFKFRLKSNENLISMAFSGDSDTQFSLLLETGINSGGVVTKVLRSASFDLTENQNPPFTKLEFFDKDSGAELFDIRSPFLYRGKNSSSITFSAYMYNKYGYKVNKIFVGNYAESPIEVSAVTKQGDLFVQPTFVNDQTIAYFKLIGSEKELMYSSSSDEKIAQSDTILDDDIKEAFYSLISLLFVGLVLLLLAFTWIVPGLGFGYVTLAFLQKLRKPYAFSVSLYVNTFGLVISQLVLFSTVLHPERIVLKAPYLTEDWHVSLVIIIAGIGCILPVLLSRTKVTDDNCNILILYTTGLNLFILFLLLGPYFI
ncbi:MAG TPA: hypothetical protein VI423_01965 [Paenisporosarcina sp.]|nr:hypothetical protein [Paenisporosarcina sp.]